MTPSFKIIEGDCVQVMAAMPEASVDAICTDPPYGLEFMGKDWDRLAASPRGRTTDMQVDAPTVEHQDDTPQHRSAVRQPSYLLRCERCGGNSSGQWNRCECATPDFRERSDLKHGMQDWHEMWAREALRILKPGGHLLAFGGTRTYHRLVCAVEDAGFEIRDTIAWMYGSGFPKSLDVSKAIDKAARGVPQGGADPTSPNHGQFKTQATEGRRSEDDRGRGFGAGPGQFMLKPGDIDPKTGRKVKAAGQPVKRMIPGADQNKTGSWIKDNGREFVPIETEPATPEAEQWSGWGTALKPAHEPIVMARKPLTSTVAKNVLEYGTGALNIDASRVGTTKDVPASPSRTAGTSLSGSADGTLRNETGDEGGHNPAVGRWPSNVILSHAEGCVSVGTRQVRGSRIDKPYEGDAKLGYNGGSPGRPSRGHGDENGLEEVVEYRCVPGCPVAELDRQSRTLKSGDGNFIRESSADGFGNRGAAYGAESRRAGTEMVSYGDQGGASRFFYVAKASTAERRAGLQEFDDEGNDVSLRNAHPTVKPLDLMRYLVRLVTPPGGTVLDCFAGSGSTGMAAVELGFDFIGIEREPEYVAIARRRIAWWAKHRPRSGKAPKAVKRPDGQLPLC